MKAVNTGKRNIEQNRVVYKGLEANFSKNVGTEFVQICKEWGHICLCRSGLKKIIWCND